jgi:molecular chaperone GrpE
MSEQENNTNPQNAENKTEEQVEEKTAEEKAAEQVEALKTENKSLNDKILRLAAELENTRRRGKDDLEKANKYAVSNFASDLVQVLENFYLAADNLPQKQIEESEEVKNFANAMIMTKKELTKTLEKYKINRIYPLGEKFDHNLHEAISQIAAENEEDDGVVKKVIQAGYSISDRLIKPALVAVANK